MCIIFVQYYIIIFVQYLQMTDECEGGRVVWQSQLLRPCNVLFCAVFVQYLCNNYTAFVQYLYIFCIIFVQHLDNICAIFVQYHITTARTCIFYNIAPYLGYDISPYLRYDILVYLVIVSKCVWRKSRRCLLCSQLLQFLMLETHHSTWVQP